LKNNKLKFKPKKNKGSITLALGGGGARGNAHVGVLRALENADIRVAALAGSSMGGLVAALYASGFSAADLEERFAALERKNLFRRGRDVANAIMGLDGVANMLGEVLGEITFDDLPIPLALTAVDLITGQEVILSNGSVVESVLATIAIPGVFPTRRMNGYELMDGALSNPIPVELARSFAPNLPVVASVLSRPPEPGREIPETKALGPSHLFDRVSSHRLMQAWSVFTRSIGISGRLLAELRMGIEKPDVIIRPDVDHIGWLDDVDVHELVHLGEAATMAAMPELRAAIAKRKDLFGMLSRFGRRDARSAPIRQTD
jgi:NTE family protein